jgi:hypothetical protein
MDSVRSSSRASGASAGRAEAFSARIAFSASDTTPVTAALSENSSSVSGAGMNASYRHAFLYRGGAYSVGSFCHTKVTRRLGISLMYGSVVRYRH